MKTRESGIGPIITASLCLLASGCAYFSPELPPFRYVSVELRKGASLPCHAAVGIAYRIVNGGDKPITALRVSFWVYGPDGAPLPAVSRNFIQASASVTIDPGAEVEVCTSLDDVFFYVPQGEVEIANFRIASVDFADGSLWSDPFSHFVYPGPIPNVEESDEGP